MGCSGNGGNTNLLQAVFDAFGPGCGNLYNETSALYGIDLGGMNGIEPDGGFNSYYSGQYSSLWAWRSIGYSNYNGLQVSLKKDFSHGVLFDLNYTYSKSLDIASESERGIHYLTDSIMNPWNPNQMYGPSDFDLRHQINGYWVAELPFGHGKAYGGNMRGWQDAALGGWQLGGTVRWTSGFPFSAFYGYYWPTNWDEMGWADPTGQPLNEGRTIVNGTPYMFTNPTTAVNAFTAAYPGESGVRNNLRGDGYMSVDMNLSKTWRIPRTDHQNFQIRWSVYNITNTTRFDIYSSQDNVTSGGFGQYLSTLSQPRVMEFSGVYSF